MDLAASLLARESASGSVDALVEAMKVRTDRIGTISVLFWFFFRVASVRLADFRFPRPRPRRKNDEDDSRRARVSAACRRCSVRGARRGGHRPRGGGRGVLRRLIFEPVQLLSGPARAVQQTAVLQILHRLPELRVLHFRADHLPCRNASTRPFAVAIARVSRQSAHPRKTRREGAE